MIGGSSPAGPPAISGATWLAASGPQSVMRAIAGPGDEEARVVGGAVRDALLGLPVADIDIATTATPDVVAARAAAAGFKVVPTGIEHGTVTVIAHGDAIEVTTLRSDIATDGRRATVVFGRDWRADALRRDFTLNALSVSADGVLHDPAGGYADCLARRVRFIGDADARIREDYLRILRFFRFHARYGSGPPDAAGLAAALRGRDGLRRLSAERIGQEMRKLVTAPGAAATVETMAETGILEIVLAGVVRLRRFQRRAALLAAQGRADAPAPALSALAAWLAEDVERVADRLRLSNAERRRMLAAVAAGDMLAATSGRADRTVLWRVRPEAYRDAVTAAWADAEAPADDETWARRLAEADDPPPPLPVAGRDLLARGVTPGPEIGRLLAEAEARWIASGFTLGREALLDLVAAR